MKISKEIIERYNSPGPRYTSYPPANQFREGLTEKDLLEQVELSNREGHPGISLYVHVPFCPKICHFCGCNSHVGKDETRISSYFDALLLEIDRVAAELNKERPVIQVHWGGGTPNAVNLKHVARIMERFRQHFQLAENAEIAMECNPAYMQVDHLDVLKSLGFNRLSIGVQDFNQEVLRLVNRDASLLPLPLLLEEIRKRDFARVNLDFIYGLPGQDIHSYLESLHQAVKLRPERLVTFSYAHLPGLRKNQSLLDGLDLPGPEKKLDMLVRGFEYLSSSGYEAIGMDHFALPDDELALAYKARRLHRNFQGYCALEHSAQVYAFGASAISQLQSSYFQNEKHSQAYVTSMEQGQIPVIRGHVLSREELRVREVINALMCSGELHLTESDRQFFQYHPDKFRLMEADGLVETSESGLRVTPLGMLLVRVIARAFDPAFQNYQDTFSKVI